METGNPIDGVQSIDELHARILGETGNGTDTPPVVETDGNPIDPAAPVPAVNEEFTKEIIGTVCKWHAETVHDEFFALLAPIAGQETAERIAARAAMSPSLQMAVSVHGSKVITKHGLAGFVNDEAVLIGALLMYFKTLSGARKEAKAIVKKAKLPEEPEATPPPAPSAI